MSCCSQAVISWSLTRPPRAACQDKDSTRFGRIPVRDCLTRGDKLQLAIQQARKGVNGSPDPQGPQRPHFRSRDWLRREIHADKSHLSKYDAKALQSLTMLRHFQAVSLKSVARNHNIKLKCRGRNGAVGPSRPANGVHEDFHTPRGESFESVSK